MKAFQFDKLVRDKISKENSGQDDIGNFQVGVVVTLVNKTNKILMAKRSDHVANAPGRWETASGRIAGGESPEQTINREIAEELGAEIKFKIVEPYYTFRITRDDGHELIGISYYCKYLGGPIHLNKEHTDYRWVSIDQAIKLIQTPGLKTELRYFKKKYFSVNNPRWPRRVMDKTSLIIRMIRSKRLNDLNHLTFLINKLITNLKKHSQIYKTVK